jgi:DNA-binding transcriptional MerR regulator
MSNKKANAKTSKIISFNVREVARIVGASRRRLDYWNKTGLLTPSLKGINDKGSPALYYSVQDIIDLKIILRLRQSSIPLQRIRAGFRFIKEQQQTLASSVILSDGKTLYLYQDDDLLVDILKKGQMVSRVSVQDLIAEVQEKVRKLENSKNGRKA